MNLKKNNSKEGLILTKRDLSVLHFVFQMRFASSMQIMKACFAETLLGKTRSSDLYIKRRLAQLVAGNFLSCGRPPSIKTQKYYYRITRLGLSVLQGDLVTYEITKVPEIKFSNFDHDSHVIDCRISLEKQGRATEWTPEFEIKARYNAFADLPAKYIPDALFINKLGELTALEMEISRKAKVRYEDKIQKYVSIVRSHFNEEIKFKRVLYVAKHKDVFNLLSEMTRIHADIFRIESFDSVTESL